jgi:hypothetical protein
VEPERNSVTNRLHGGHVPVTTRSSERAITRIEVAKHKIPLATKGNAGGIVERGVFYAGGVEVMKGSGFVNSRTNSPVWWQFRIPPP